MKWILHVAVVPVLVMNAGCVMLLESHLAREWKEERAPDFELTALDGERVRLSAVRGKPVILSFFFGRVSTLSCGGSALNSPGRSISR